MFNAVTGLIGGLGIFLLGMRFLSDGLRAIAGDGLRRMISLVTDNRYFAVCVGLTVTVLVQSSSITTVMTVGLVNSGFMALKQALGVIFGANIGTTITGWIVLLKIGKFGLPILGVSAFVYLFSRNERLRHIGMIVMGIGMVFFGMELMKKGLKPISEVDEFMRWFEAFDASTLPGRIKCALVGCVLTMIVQSSSATLVITMNLATTGLIGYETAAALVMGENIGTTITAWLAAIGANIHAKRAAYGHMLFNVLGVCWMMLAFPLFIRLVAVIIGHEPNTFVEGAEVPYPHIQFSIALTHTLFNVINTLLFLPFLKQIAWIAIRLAPDRPTENKD
ncbi:MAG: Na/Pi cotransporter family protein [Verrucomicrobiota bacterium]